MNNAVSCTRCLMDTTDPDLTIDENGICHHCLNFDLAKNQYTFTESQIEKNLEEIKAKLHKGQKKSDYHCLIGLSGGTDSSYVAYLAYKLGLNPLTVHFDNGWNSEVAVSNIKKIVDGFGFDLMTYVINWDEFRDLQRAFIKASVIDIELLTDHAITAAMYKLARENKIYYVLGGDNFATEHGMPRTWVWRKHDFRNIKRIHKRFGQLKLKTFPHMSKFKWLLLRKYGIINEFIPLLNYINYEKGAAVRDLKAEIGWQDYGGKHYESVFTKFYQCYILPEKFGIDKRKVHLSALIRNGENTREEAIEALSQPLYSETELRQDKEYVIKKLGFTEAEFDRIMKEKPVPHDFYSKDGFAVGSVNSIVKKIINPKQTAGLKRVINDYHN